MRWPTDEAPDVTDPNEPDLPPTEEINDGTQDYPGF
jgi:hypothetical protein